MAVLNITDLSYENITLAYSEQTDENGAVFACLKFEGDMDMQDPDAICMPYLQDIHSQMTQNDVKKIQLDFRPLRFLNSSGIKLMVKRVQMMLILPADKVYSMEILANSAVAWQDNCLKLLSLLAPKLINIKLL